MTQHASQPEGPLGDLLVLELGDEGTQYTGRLLGELGARVVKIEPVGGARARHRGPFKDDKPDVNTSLYFWAYNTNKESITLDLSKEADRQKVREMAEKADVILEDYRPGYLESIGLGYARLSRKNPRLIMTSVTPFGQTGPLKDWKGGDLIHWATGSILNKSGYPDTGPIYPQGDVSYVIAGHHAMIGTMVALTARDVTGEGQQVDLSIQEACCFVSRAFVPEFAGGMDARTFGGGNPDKEAFMCTDGKYVLPQASFTLPSHWANLIQWFKEEGVGQHLWHLDEKALADMQTKNRGRLPALQDFDKVVTELGKRRASYELTPIAQKLGFTWVAYNYPDELLEDEQLKYRDFFKSVYHPEHKASYAYAGEPYKFSKAEWKIRRRPPLLGEDNNKLSQLLANES